MVPQGRPRKRSGGGWKKPAIPGLPAHCVRPQADCQAPSLPHPLLCAPVVTQGHQVLHCSPLSCFSPKNSVGAASAQQGHSYRFSLATPHHFRSGPCNSPKTLDSFRSVPRLPNPQISWSLNISNSKIFYGFFRAWLKVLDYFGCSCFTF